MAATKQPKTKKRVKQRVASEYRFEIDAFTPDTMPMVRLAEYLTHLAAVLGEPKAVHFLRVEPGSTVPVFTIEHEAIPKVRERTTAVRRGEAPRDAHVAFKAINRLLREDNGVAVLRDKNVRAPILLFPGRNEAEEKFPAVRQSGTIDGEIRKVGGWDSTVPISLLSEGEHIVGCWADEHTARQLGMRMFEPVRLFGRGKWSRDQEGDWTLEDFKIEGFEPLQKASLTSAIAKLRAIGGDWGEDAYTELTEIRHGKAEQGNGDH